MPERSSLRHQRYDIYNLWDNLDDVGGARGWFGKATTITTFPSIELIDGIVIMLGEGMNADGFKPIG